MATAIRLVTRPRQGAPNVDVSWSGTWESNPACFRMRFAGAPHCHSGSTALVGHRGIEPRVSCIRSRQITIFLMPEDQRALFHLSYRGLGPQAGDRNPHLPESEWEESNLRRPLPKRPRYHYATLRSSQIRWALRGPVPDRGIEPRCLSV